MLYSIFADEIQWKCNPDLDVDGGPVDVIEVWPLQGGQLGV
jgi:hypothetical protein